MPKIIDYPAVVQQMDRQKLVSLYPNSGAFGFAKDVPTHAVGWVGGEDPTIRPAARALTIVVPPPVVPSLATLANRAWHELLPGPVWLMPKAHWAYELDFGSAAWMPDLLRAVGVDADALSARHDGTAVEFSDTAAPPAGGGDDDGDSARFTRLVEGLLAHLLGSDFQLSFPGRDVVCTVHHHKQLWWTSPDEALIGKLRGMAG